MHPQDLFDTSDFPARWNCGTWTSLHGWIHIISDLVTFGAYFAIPICILLYRRRKPGVSFPGLIWLFAAFILSCGLVHLIEASLFWKPWYRFSALLKAITALVSVATAIAIVRILPKALRLPALATVNEELLQENKSRAQAERELLRRNRDLDAFAYVASHDLKAPLRGIHSLAKWTEEDSEGTLTPESREHLRKLVQRTNRMEKLLNDLLQYSRVGTSAEAEHIDLNHLCATAVELLAPSDKATIEVGDLPTIFAPRAPVELLFRNLIGNALKHHDGDAPHITILGEHDGEMCTLKFADDGPGIPSQYRQRIFELFQTLRPRDEVEGSGMGLAICQRSAETLDGSIELAASEGRGATFVLRLPMCSPSRDGSKRLVGK